jgi:GNAT superfamily N-acetyltransferase
VTDRIRSQLFDPSLHHADEFASGEPSLDEWLRASAATPDRRGLSRTWVWVDAGNTVLAYYSLSAHKVVREAVPTKIGRGGPREIPAVLIGKLALDQRMRGRGLGAVLLADALDRIVDASRQVGTRLVVVDALNERVAAWYESVGFRRIPDSLLLVQRVVDIAAARGDE